MIEKIISIKNYGPFTNYMSGGSEWDGTLRKNNIIYAPNGSGKTTLSILFDSLNGKTKLVGKKASLFVEGKPDIHLRIGGENYKFKDKQWDKKLSNIVTFNNFYLENNIYSVGSDSNRDDSLNTSTLFSLLNVPEASLIMKEAIRLESDRKILARRLWGSRNINEIKDDWERTRRKWKQNKKALREIKNVQVNSLAIIFKKFEEAINKYLLRFTPNIEVTKITPFYSFGKGSATFQRAAIEIKVNGNRVVLDEDGKSKIPLRYVLSEGDKNTLALAIFLAKFDLIADSESYIVVVDDPFTSFDSSRKKATIKELSRLSEKIKQLIVLTHDLNFGSELERSLLNPETLQIRILPKNRHIQSVSFEELSLQGLLKDITDLHNFSNGLLTDESDILRVARSIRPTLEGMFRIKYFNHLKKDEWLGDMIAHVKKSEQSSVFYKLKPYLEELTDVNDYSKEFHHSNINQRQSIDYQELLTFVRRTLKLVEVI